MTNSDENNELRELFNKLDKNKDGKIDFDELKDYFASTDNQINVNIKNPNRQSVTDSKKLFSKISKDRAESNFDFRDFVDYVNQTDKKIDLIFKDLDRDQNGIIDKSEIKKGFENLGIILNEAQIDKLMNHLDKNNSLQIDWKEWRDFFRFAPHDKVEEALRIWRTETFLDYADQSIPNDYTKKEKQNGLWWRNLVAGGLAGAISRTCTAPLDRVKIFLQVHGTESKLSIGSAIKNMVKEGGMASLWRGNFINVLKITPESAIKFGAYEQIKKLMGQEGQQLPPFQKFLSGALAGFVAQSTIYPMEVLKTRLALRKTGQYSSMADCVRKIYKNEGIKAFYRGYLMNTIGIAGVGIDLAFYETLKSKYKQLYPDKPQPSIFALLLIANTSSTVAMYSTYPIFLIRTRMQSSNNAKDSIATIAKRVYKNDGVFGFYRGAFANLAKVAPAASIGYISYEHINKLLGIKQE
jgi:solute carrier family 25 phosphate transporter 23/24/25/41